MRKLLAGLLAAAALTACGEGPPKTGFRGAGLPPGCWRDASGVANCPGTTAAAPTAEPTERLLHVPLQLGASGTYRVDVAIAGTCCFKMVLDTGASDVSVPLNLWYAMLKGGHINEADHIDVTKYRTANGTVEGLRFKMPTMTIEGYAVDDVIGSVTKGDNSQMILLGQSFLRKFKAWQINNATHELILTY
jgi:clan AA aspartic protease (TIGR02281 family)